MSGPSLASRICKKYLPVCLWNKSSVEAVSWESHSGGGGGGVPQDPEEHGGRLGAGDHPVPQRLRRQPGDALLPLAALAQLPAVRPRPAPHPAQHDEEGLPAVSHLMRVFVTHPEPHGDGLVTLH